MPPNIFPTDSKKGSKKVLRQSPKIFPRHCSSITYALRQGMMHQMQSKLRQAKYIPQSTAVGMPRTAVMILQHQYLVLTNAEKLVRQITSILCEPSGSANTSWKNTWIKTENWKFFCSLTSPIQRVSMGLTGIRKIGQKVSRQT